MEYVKKIIIRKLELEAQFTCTWKETIERMGKRQYWKSSWLEIFKIKEKHEFSYLKDTKF